MLTKIIITFLVAAAIIGALIVCSCSVVAGRADKVADQAWKMKKEDYMRIVVDKYPLYASECPFFDFGCKLTEGCCERDVKEHIGEYVTECSHLVEFEKMLSDRGE